MSRASKTASKERLTIEWLSQSIAELRAELSELQEASSNTSRSLQQRNTVLEDITELRTEFEKLKLDLTAMKQRQEETNKIVRELRNEAIQSADDVRKSRLHVSFLIVFVIYRVGESRSWFFLEDGKSSLIAEWNGFLGWTGDSSDYPERNLKWSKLIFEIFLIE